MDKRYEYKEHQAHTRKKWIDEEVYTQKNNPGASYTIDTPPPTVSGNLHIGHIFSYTQTDIIARYKRMNGFSVFYPFGFDDNGLPTERYVEKKLKVSAHNFTRSEFINLCLKETRQAEEEFKNLWQQIGLSVDWNYCYSTISKNSRKVSQESFLRLLEKDYVYRKNEPALYCTACRTSVAQAELDDKEVPSFFNNIVFKDEKGNDLIVGTTRPELLPSCVAMLYHPDDTRYTHLKGSKATVPLFNYQVPILQDELVEPSKGTGLVMVCTFGDKTDIEWFKKFNLPYKQSIGRDGKFTKDTGILAGLKVPEARKTIIEELIKENLLVGQKEITHAVNTHERCKKEIEYVMIPQWFLKILDYKKEFLALADQIDWYPTHMKSRYINWVENIGWDWCLSRQRFYGIAFPIWHCNGCQKILTPSFDQLPIDPQETEYPGKTCPACKSSDITPDTDVMDTWNTSSITPYLCYTEFNKDFSSPFTDGQAESFIPMSMRPQAHDIIRTWAFYTIVKTWMHSKHIPWRNIVISGHVLADSKEKLSKSKGQKALAPQKLLENYPADAIRYWTASGGLGHDIAFSETQLKIGQKLITKLWNAFRFVSEHIKEKPQAPTQFGTINEWLLDQISSTCANYKKYFEKNEFGLALNALETFFWQTFCDNYLELIKDQLFNPDKYDQELIHATRWTLYTVGLRILQLYAPYMPYVTEALYEALYKVHEGISSIHMTKFATIQDEYVFDESSTLMAELNTIISAVRKLKSENQLSLKVPIAQLTIHSAPERQEALKEHEALLRGITHAEQIVFANEPITKAHMKEKNEIWHMWV